MKAGGKLLQQLRHQRYLKRLGQQLDQADKVPLGELRQQCSQARHVLRPLTRFLRLSEGRLADPLTRDQKIPAPVGTDWTWRPKQWRTQMAEKGFAGLASETQIGEDATVFHDCSERELIVKQVRNRNAGDGARFGLRFDVFHFAGSFLSLVVDLPPEAVAGLKKRHLFRLDTSISVERGIDLYARLNIKHGPNTEKLVSKISTDGAGSSAEFDLAYTQLNEQRVEKIWVDFIFENPAHNQIELHDVTFSRRPRSEI